MKRIDLYTKILVKLEDKGINEDIREIEDYPVDEFYYNARMLANVCLIEITDLGDITDRPVQPLSLHGQDMTSLRNPKARSGLLASKSTALISERISRPRASKPLSRNLDPDADLVRGLADRIGGRDRAVDQRAEATDRRSPDERAS